MKTNLKTFFVLLIILSISIFSVKKSFCQDIHAEKSGVSIGGQLLTKNANVTEAIGDGYVFALSKDTKQILGYSETISGFVHNRNVHLQGGRWRISDLPINTEIVLVGFAKKVKRLVWIETVYTTNVREIDLGENLAYMHTPGVAPSEAGVTEVGVFPILQAIFIAGWITELTEGRRYIQMVDELVENILELHSSQIKSDSFTDSRDGKTYKTVKIGNQVWMAENLAFKPSIGNYWVYDDGNSDVTKYGYLYDWQTSGNVCPLGWHLPSDADWTQLYNFVGSNPGTKLKAKSGWSRNGNGTDDYGFSALPGGLRSYERGTINFVGNSGYWWCSTEDDATLAWRRYMDSDDGDVYRRNINKRYGFSVRCIKD